MQVYDISVSFSRTIQVREYEPSKAEVFLKAQLVEGENSSEALAKLFAEAKASVRAVLNKTAAGATTESTAISVSAPVEATSAVASTAAPAKRGRPAGSTKKAEAPAATASEFSDEPAAPAAPAPAAAKAPAKVEADEFSEAEDDEFSEAEKAMTTKDLQEQLSALVNSKAIDAMSVKAILQKYGAARSAETKDGDRAKILDEVKAAIAAKKG